MIGRLLSAHYGRVSGDKAAMMGISRWHISLDYVFLDEYLFGSVAESGYPKRLESGSGEGVHCLGFVRRILPAGTETGMKGMFCCC